MQEQAHIDGVELLADCPLCGYALEGLPTEHRCPECGFEIDRRWSVFGPGLTRVRAEPVRIAIAIASFVVWTGFGVAILLRYGVFAFYMLFVVPTAVFNVIVLLRARARKRHNLSWISIGPSGLQLRVGKTIEHVWNWGSFDYARLGVPFGGIELVTADGKMTLDGKSERRLRRLGDKAAVQAINRYRHRGAGARLASGVDQSHG